MPWRLMRKWTNSNICCTVTDGSFAVQICQRCTFDPKKKNPYGQYQMQQLAVADAALPIVARLTKHRKTLLNTCKTS